MAHNSYILNPISTKAPLGYAIDKVCIGMLYIYV